MHGPAKSGADPQHFEVAASITATISPGAFGFVYHQWRSLSQSWPHHGGANVRRSLGSVGLQSVQCSDPALLRQT